MRHHLLFYEEPAALIDGVAAFAREGLAAGDLVLIVATAPHHAAFAAQLAASGCDVDRARKRGNYLTLDAAGTLASFCTEGAVDPARFDAVVGGLLSGALARGRSVRVFGEMVALLWEAGHTDAAVELEGLWEDLRARQPFDLMCAYPADVLACGDDYEQVNEVCAAHSEVALGLKEPHRAEVHAFPGALNAVRDARHFVANCVGHGATHDRMDDALLITSELSANAVYHAKTPFVLELAWYEDVMRIGVRDGFNGRPKLAALNPHSGSGRGMAMIDAISARWGIEAHRRGKTVWAEVAL